MLYIKPIVLTLGLAIPVEYYPTENKFAKDIPYQNIIQERLPSTMEYNPFPQDDISNIIYDIIIKELQEPGDH